MIPQGAGSHTRDKDLEKLFYLQKANEMQVRQTTAAQRIAKLKRLRECILQHRDEIHQALHADLRKPGLETDITEIKTVVTEINYAIGRLYRWMQPERVSTPLMLLGTSSYIQYEPKGTVLIMGPWNFPFLLVMGPLTGAIAAGNCAICKPSEHTPHTFAIARRIVEMVFEANEVAMVEGDAGVAQTLLKLPFNHIFFTGSYQTGRHVMRAAADHLCSVTLELGGKSPLLIDQTADLRDAAAKGMWLKFMNNGQICISPDYVLVHESVADQFLKETLRTIRHFYGTTPEARQQSPDLCRMVNDSHFNRVRNIIEDARSKGAIVHMGGIYDADDRYIDATVLTNVDHSMTVMQEEIFGPVLPIVSYRTQEEAAAYINRGSVPLSFYIFSQSRAFIDYILHHTKAGDVCINECGHHFYNPNLAFGGMGMSGLGKAHGKYFFLEFSNAKGVLTRHMGRFSPLKVLLPPYKPWVVRLFRYVIRWP